MPTSCPGFPCGNGEGVKITWVDVDSHGARWTRRRYWTRSPDRTKLIAVTHLSNVLGTRVDVKAICAGAQGKGRCRCWSTAARPPVHMPVDVQDIGCDFYAVTGHKPIRAERVRRDLCPGGERPPGDAALHGAAATSIREGSPPPNEGGVVL